MSKDKMLELTDERITELAWVAKDAGPDVMELVKESIRQAAAEGVKACAAIKDAEIARQMDIQAEWAALARKQEEEIAVRDLMIKELRGLLLQLSYNEFGAERFPSEESVEQALANSEHHNSRALEKMLLEARQEAYANGLRAAKDAAWVQHKHHGRDKATAYQVHEVLMALYTGAIHELERLKRNPEAKLAELNNKE